MRASGPPSIPRAATSPLPSPEEALAYPYSAADLQQVRNSRRMLVAGTPDRVRERLDELATQLGADELMVTSHIHGHEERLHSYQLLADVYGLGRSSTGEIHVPLG